MSKAEQPDWLKKQREYSRKMWEEKRRPRAIARLEKRFGDFTGLIVDFTEGVDRDTAYQALVEKVAEGLGSPSSEVRKQATDAILYVSEASAVRVADGAIPWDHLPPLD